MLRLRVHRNFALSHRFAVSRSILTVLKQFIVFNSLCVQY